MSNINPWLAIIFVWLLFLLSLSGAYVLFKFLESVAQIDKASYRAGGALAGFLIIFGTLFAATDRWISQMELWCPKKWDIKGMVGKQGAASHEGVAVTQVPPLPNDVTDRAGYFHLKGIEVIEAGGWPGIYFQSDGYYPRQLNISEDVATINKTGKIIELKNPIELGRLSP